MEMNKVQITMILDVKGYTFSRRSKSKGDAEMVTPNTVEIKRIIAHFKTWEDFEIICNSIDSSDILSGLCQRGLKDLSDYNQSETLALSKDDCLKFYPVLVDPLLVKGVLIVSKRVMEQFLDKDNPDKKNLYAMFVVCRKHLTRC